MGILNKYCEKFNHRPMVRIIRCGNVDKNYNIYDGLVKAGYDVEYQEFSGDYNSIPNLLLFLNKNSKLELLCEIMSHPLPQRKTA